jgi:hypothetical protein
MWLRRDSQLVIGELQLLRAISFFRCAPSLHASIHFRAGTLEAAGQKREEEKSTNLPHPKAQLLHTPGASHALIHRLSTYTLTKVDRRAVPAAGY